MVHDTRIQCHTHALGGYDPVAYFTLNEPALGSAEYSFVWDDAEWHFVSAEHRELFTEDPERYAPAYGGYCAVIALAHDVGQRIVYHTCGGMMPILEDIASMQPDAMETFTPPEMGADVNLAEAKKRIGTKVAMIGGFDQVHFFTDRSPEETRTAVRRCFEEAGDNGGYILAPSDHFFEAKIDLLHAFVDEAKSCTYQ